MGEIELRHYTMIIYAIPSERIERLLPAGFETDDLQMAGKKISLLSISSFQDVGTRHLARTAFEQTDYRLHVKQNGERSNYLLGSSVGSLSAIAKRHLWQMPWHLGAMEFQINYNAEEDRYTNYRLLTQSQWANAYWEFADRSDGIKPDFDRDIPGMIKPGETIDYFLRPDGSIGLRKLRFSYRYMTKARLLQARCDLLLKIGLLGLEEILRPLQIVIFRNVSCAAANLCGNT